MLDRERLPYTANGSQVNGEVAILPPPDWLKSPNLPLLTENRSDDTLPPSTTLFEEDITGSLQADSPPKPLEEENGLNRTAQISRSAQPEQQSESAQDYLKGRAQLVEALESLGTYLTPEVRKTILRLFDLEKFPEDIAKDPETFLEKIIALLEKREKEEEAEIPPPYRLIKANPEDLKYFTVKEEKERASPHGSPIQEKSDYQKVQPPYDQQSRDVYVAPFHVRRNKIIQELRTFFKNNPTYKKLYRGTVLGIVDLYLDGKLPENLRALAPQAFDRAILEGLTDYDIDILNRTKRTDISPEDRTRIAHILINDFRYGIKGDPFKRKERAERAFKRVKGSLFEKTILMPVVTFDAMLAIPLHAFNKVRTFFR
ncbi:MAG: hypothetical protein UU81_C0005G0005 [Microgenomates group bacterium GW2011_GWC1_41_8]|nr:MAG: hypothetical protein UU81_C0005G0005 [Microgenomates group bacterium GW2011_GWC1_41_8]HLC71226.1 hypothetical protein [Candidatus Nanoarchaeia archaeon]